MSSLINMDRSRSLRVFTTGGAGFIGSHFIDQIIKLGMQVYNFDILSYASNVDHVDSLKREPLYDFYKGDIRSFDEVLRCMSKFKPDYVVNFAAESHVDRSITSPSSFTDVNVTGTSNLLRATMQVFAENNTMTQNRFIQIGTDEVYGTRFKENPALETCLLLPSNVYSASKAAADLLALAFHKTYGLPVIVTRSCNNYGPRQHSEKLIPKIFACMKAGEKFPIYGSGEQVRQWIHVTDNVNAIIKTMLTGSAGEIYNVGSPIYIENINIIKKINELINYKNSCFRDGQEQTWTHVEDRLGHDLSYSINYEKITRLVGSINSISFESGLSNLADYYLNQCHT